MSVSGFAIIAILLAAPVGQAAQQAATPAPPTKVAAAGRDRDKVICKRFAETGSLVRSTKVCKTRADWDKDREQARSSVGVSNGCRELNGAGGC